MILNVCKGDMYANIDFTCNPIRGRCPFNCVYCYAKTGFRKKIRAYQVGFHRNDEILAGDPPPPKSVVFVGSMTDMWMAPPNHIEKVLKRLQEANEGYSWEDKVRWLFQSKCPDMFREYLDMIPDRSILMTTIESDYTPRNISNAPSQIYRAKQMGILQGIVKRFRDPMQIGISVEPIMQFNMIFADVLKSTNPDFVSMGAMTKKEYEKHWIPAPEPDRVIALVKVLREKYSIHVMIKRNLMRLAERGKQREEFRAALDDLGCWLTWETEGDTADERLWNWVLDRIETIRSGLHGEILMNYRKPSRSIYGTSYSAVDPYRPTGAEIRKAYEKKTEDEK